MSSILSNYDPKPLIKAQEGHPEKNNSWLSRTTGLSRPSVIKVMNGKTDDLSLIKPVARALGVSMTELFAKAA